MRKFSTHVFLCLLSWSAIASAAVGAPSQLVEAKKLLDQGNYPPAIRALERVLASDPDQRDANILLAFALARSGQIQPAIAQTRRALSIAPDNANLELLLAGLLASELESVDEAIVIYQRVLENHPANLAAQEGVAEHFRRAGNALKSAELYQRLSRQKPDEARYHVGLAESYLLLGELDLATNEYEQAARLTPDNRQVIRSLAIIYEARDEHAKSLSYYQQLTHLEPDSLGNKLALKRLQQENAPQLSISIERIREAPLSAYLTSIDSTSPITDREKHIGTLHTLSKSRYLPTLTYLPSFGSFQQVNNVTGIEALDSFNHTFAIGFDLRNFFADPAEEKMYLAMADKALVRENIGKEVVELYYARLETVANYENLQRMMIQDPDDPALRRRKNSLRLDLVRMTERLYLLTGVR